MATDTSLARVIETALMADGRLSAKVIRISVTVGRVTLEGVVPTYRRRLAAEELVASFDGVRDIVNHLTVEPSELIPDEDVAANVRAAIDSNADVNGEAISVVVRDGVAALRGSVGSRWEQANAEEVAHSARGVREIHSSLALNQVNEDAERLSGQDLEMLLAHVRGLRDTKIAVVTSNGEVVLCGEVREFEQKRTAETVVRRLGLRRIRNGIIVRGNSRTRPR